MNAADFSGGRGAIGTCFAVYSVLYRQVIVYVNQALPRYSTLADNRLDTALRKSHDGQGVVNAWFTVIIARRLGGHLIILFQRLCIALIIRTYSRSACYTIYTAKSQ